MLLHQSLDLLQIAAKGLPSKCYRLVKEKKRSRDRVRI